VSSETKKQADTQRRRFIKAARDLGCDEDESAFDEALGKVVSSPPPKSVEKRKTKKSSK